ncbi:MAG: hypothetical protein HC842_03495 [Cytophagales bacterium]|nr:hypothetical protein [Cytophagales bacterium]
MKKIYQTSALFCWLLLGLSACQEDEKPEDENAGNRVAFVLQGAYIFEDQSVASRVEVLLSTPASADVEVNIGLDELDLSPADYSTSPAALDKVITLVIPSGQSSAFVDVMPVDNDQVDTDRTLKLTLLSASAGYQKATTNQVFALQWIDDEGDKKILVYSYDFQGSSLGEWTPHNILGPQKWSVSNTGRANDPYALMSGFNSATSSTQANEDWLISPQIDLSGIPEATVVFENATSFGSDANSLLVMVSSDYDGSSSPAASGTWQEAALANALSSGSFAWVMNLYLCHETH